VVGRLLGQPGRAKRCGDRAPTRSQHGSDHEHHRVGEDAPGKKRAEDDHNPGKRGRQGRHRQSLLVDEMTGCTLLPRLRSNG